MAKKIRFPLQMKDGAAVRTLEELREHFDLESVLGYFADGKLKTWLSDRYYDEMAEKVAALTADMPNLNAKLCEILGVEYSSESDDTDFEALQRQNEKLRVLREVTDDQEILENVDAVAFDQDELFDILDDAPDVIYLYGDKFSIPYTKSGITYIGVNNPKVSLEKNELEYKKNGIMLESIRFANKLDAGSIVVALELIQEEKYDEGISIIKKLAEAGETDAQYLLGHFYQYGIGIEENEKYAEEWYLKAAEHGEPRAQYELGELYQHKLHNAVEDKLTYKEVTQAESNVIKWFQKAAEQGYAEAEYSLGKIYENGYVIEPFYYISAEWFSQIPASTREWIDSDYDIAAEWYRKAISHGLSSAQDALESLNESIKYKENGAMDNYDKGMGFFFCEEYEEAIEYLKKALDAGYKNAMEDLSECYIAIKDYQSAIQYYQMQLNDCSDNRYIVKKIADCYYDLNQPIQAIEWYEKWIKSWLIRCSESKRPGLGLIKHDDNYIPDEFELKSVIPNLIECYIKTGYRNTAIRLIQGLGNPVKAYLDRVNGTNYMEGVI